VAVGREGAVAVDVYPRFDEVVLLSAPADVILERVATRDTNDFGKTDAERDRSCTTWRRSSRFCALELRRRSQMARPRKRLKQAERAALGCDRLPIGAHGKEGSPVEIRKRVRPDEKTAWAAVALPLLAERGYPVPEILRHSLLDDDWHLVVLQRLPGRPVELLTDEFLALVSTWWSPKPTPASSRASATWRRTTRSWSSMGGITFGATPRLPRLPPSEAAGSRGPSGAGVRRSHDRLEPLETGSRPQGFRVVVHVERWR
jgi:hypothetical protein